MSGFIVRWDGALISIDEIIWIEPVDIGAPVIPRKYNILIHMKNGHNAMWNKESRDEPETRALLRQLTELIQKAISLD